MEGEAVEAYHRKMKRTVKRLIGLTTVLLIATALVATIGCVRQSGGVWYFHEAGTPKGWPELTPVGQVQVKQYPAYREAVVTRETTSASQGSMFRKLFSHIQQSDISMTAPVDMGYRPVSGAPELQSMAFLYDVPERGGVVDQGEVIVRDVPARPFASIGVRGSYSEQQFQEAVEKLHEWLRGSNDFQPAGSPRYLGYNSPFIPFFWRYGEVQIPVQASSK